MTKRAILVVIDGFGHGKRDHTDAVFAANTPFLDTLYRDYPNAELTTHGSSVGLPEGQMGNSEVGHIHLGAGRVIWQELPRITNAISDGSFFSNPVMNSALEHAKQYDRAVHVMGLVSDGGVHSHVDHCKAVCKAAADAGIRKLFVHAFTDGRDTDPHSGLRSITDLHRFLGGQGGKIATVVGRYYAMDRDKRWPRTRRAYDLLVRGIGSAFGDPMQGVQASYDAGITDEFIEPIVISDNAGKPLATIQNGDVIIFFNFRTDRPRQIIRALTQQDLPEHGMNKLLLRVVTMTEYDTTFKGIDVMFPPQQVNSSFGEYISGLGLTQLRIAETEKYPHVTYFFSCGREEPFPGERRILIPSPKVATYDLQPEMSAHEVTAAVIREIKSDPPDFICLNFANADMVGHTGVFSATVKACETVDTCLKEIVATALEQGYSLVITSDHGNADLKINPDGSPHTAHTLNPVPVFVISTGNNSPLQNGTLIDIAPTLCSLLDLETPSVMTGRTLTERQPIRVS